MELGPKGVEVRHPSVGLLASVAPLKPVDERWVMLVGRLEDVHGQGRRLHLHIRAVELCVNREELLDK